MATVLTYIDFPGTVTIGWSTFVEYLLDILLKPHLSRCQEKILIGVNGHVVMGRWVKWPPGWELLNIRKASVRSFPGGS